MAAKKGGYYHKNHRAVSASEVAQIIDLWDEHTVREIAEIMEISVKRIRYIANAVRDVDFNVLTPKHARGYFDKVIADGIKLSR